MIYEVNLLLSHANSNLKDIQLSLPFIPRRGEIINIKSLIRHNDEATKIILSGMIMIVDQVSWTVGVGILPNMTHYTKIDIMVDLIPN